MKILVISKPIYEFILPLVEFPSDGDIFNINKAVNTITNSGSLAAITLKKYGLDIEYNGVIGEDDIGKKIKSIFEDNNVKTDYIETCYEEKSAVTYKIYNSKTNKFTTINEIGSKAALTKYKYDFVPEVVVMDDKDYNANLAALNNYNNAMFIYMSEKYTKESSVFLNKCKYVICNLNFASEAAGVLEGLNKEKNLVLLFQKFIDLYSANLIIKLDNFDILYCVDDEVRLIKNINKSITNKDNVYYSVLVYFLVKNIDLENAIKLTNKVMLSSNSELDMIKDIPDYSVVEQVLKEFNEVNKQQTITNNVVNQTITTPESQIITQQSNVNNQVTQNESVVNNTSSQNTVMSTVQSVQESNKPEITEVPIHNIEQNQNLNNNVNQNASIQSTNTTNVQNQINNNVNNRVNNENV